MVWIPGMGQMSKRALGGVCEERTLRWLGCHGVDFMQFGTGSGK